MLLNTGITYIIPDFCLPVASVIIYPGCFTISKRQKNHTNKKYYYVDLNQTINEDGLLYADTCYTIKKNSCKIHRFN